ncbi:MAG: NFACT RNA binding domain-containing protein [Bacteroidetes bacterium]|nr:NFACT RNA binding domain-containing protein [Bacteroidota bacterium]
MVLDAWCHTPGELTLALEQDGTRSAISFLTKSPMIGAFRRKEVGRPRRNAKHLFRKLRQQFITDVSILENDRVLILKFTGGFQLHAHLYGSRANVILADDEGRVEEAFRKGAPATLPLLRNPPEPRDVTAFTVKWHEVGGNPVKALQHIYICFNRDQVEEVMGLSQQPSVVYEAAQALHLKLLNSRDSLYVYQNPPTISLIPLSARKEEDPDEYDDIDEGVREYVQRTFSERAYRAQYDPLRKDLIRMLDKASRSVDRMKREQSQPSRADEYERLGHLLMTVPPFPAGEEQIEIEDVFHPGATVTVSMDPSLNSLQNAERYYVKARKARASRAHLDTLIDQAEAKIESLKTELEALENTRTLKDLKAFQKRRIKPETSGHPFRRYSLGHSYELWVGRNAKESEKLTLLYSRPFDLWLHARGVSGAHAILRLPGRDAQPSRYLIEQAAAITAWHSKARTQSLAPVIVTPRKFVRKVRGTPLGQVSVSREEVLIVEPALP